MTLTSGVQSEVLDLLALALVFFIVGLVMSGSALDFWLITIIALVLGVDRFLDMCRTTLNVTGDLAGKIESPLYALLALEERHEPLPLLHRALEVGERLQHRDEAPARGLVVGVDLERLLVARCCVGRLMARFQVWYPSSRSTSSPVQRARIAAT